MMLFSVPMEGFAAVVRDDYLPTVSMSPFLMTTLLCHVFKTIPPQNPNDIVRVAGLDSAGPLDCDFDKPG